MLSGTHPAHRSTNPTSSSTLLWLQQASSADTAASTSGQQSSSESAGAWLGGLFKKLVSKISDGVKEAEAASSGSAGSGASSSGKVRPTDFCV